MNSIMMGEWQDVAESVFMSLIFAFLVAKLISIVISFRGENLKVVHEDNLLVKPIEPELKYSNVKSVGDPQRIVSDSDVFTRGSSCVREEGLGTVQKQHLVDDDDEWEGVENSELDEVFSAATAVVAATAADNLSQRVSNDVQLQLYELYKIAVEGPCSIPKPSALKISARAKWNAWQSLGAMSPEEAMQKYIMIVNKLYPSWASGCAVSANYQKSRSGDSVEPASAAKGPMEPVFSSFVHEEESDTELWMLYMPPQEKESDNLLTCIENGTSVNCSDSEGQAPLHWAIDCGHVNIVELLVSRSADVNAQVDTNAEFADNYSLRLEWSLCLILLFAALSFLSFETVQWTYSILHNVETH